MPYGQVLWKKLAEVFGRAVEDPAATKRGRKSNYPDIADVETKKFIED